MHAKKDPCVPSGYSFYLRVFGPRENSETKLTLLECERVLPPLRAPCWLLWSPCVPGFMGLGFMGFRVYGFRV